MEAAIEALFVLVVLMVMMGAATLPGGWSR